jgi:hypothetical protein
MNLDNDFAYSYLEVAYDKLISSIRQAKKKLVGGSVLLAIMKLSSNELFNIISNSVIEVNRNSLSLLSKLEIEGLIKKTDITEKSNSFVITCKGIFFLESKSKNLDINSILNFIELEKLDFSNAHKELKNDEKIIILLLLSLRSFSKDTSMNLNDEDFCNKWEEIIENSTLPYLSENNIVNSKSIFSLKTGNEHPVSYLMRHANDLPKKTYNLFASTKSNEYYLNIITNDKEQAEGQISSLLGKVFVSIDSIQKERELINYLCSTAHKYGLSVMTSLDYLTFDWDNIIGNAVERVYLGLNN